MNYALRGLLAEVAVLGLATSLSAQKAPADLLPPEPAPVIKSDVMPDESVVVSEPVVQETAPVVQQTWPAVQKWSIADANELAAVIEGISAEGLDPNEYGLDGLRLALAGGPGDALNQAASASFSWLAEDLRDGRTPMSARRQWFVVDPDADRMPTAQIMATALTSGDIAGVLAQLNPTHPDYARLKEELAKTPKSDAAKRKLLRANMDRWRWLARDLGNQYLMTNVPEFQLRLTVNDKIVRTYKTIVGKPGRTATPQLAETVEGVIFNPTWTVPQSIVKGEGLGARVLGNPAYAKAKGYKATRGANGYITVVQQPGPGNSLGLMKLDMPNEHAIFLHDTPSRGLFNSEMRALSHGCVRTERASELALTLAILQAGIEAEEGVAILKSGKYTRVGFKQTMPVYITYFTMGVDIDGNLRRFNDIYGRDAPVLESFDKPRQFNRARYSDEEVIVIEDDMRT
ncbi:MAG: L,D-transpeptidase family protein [Sphingomonadaceae bacterium]|nr:L,D-transpeptidase family protein [Sphingomonadaceae bacterium]